MSEFKFSCPNCQQVIQATPEYSGSQIPCPACQTPLVVPDAPGAPAPHAKLSMAATTTSHSADAPFVPQRAPVRKKKNRTALYVWLGVGTCAVVAGICFGPTLYDKYNHHEEAVAAQEAATNAPPPPPPPVLTTEEILEKVSETYQGLTSFVAEGESVGAIDVSQINPRMQSIQNFKTAFSLELGRPGYFRMEWSQGSGGAVRGAAWSAGKGDFVGYGPYPATKQKDRQTAFATATAASATFCADVVQIFFGDTNSVALETNNFAKTNGPALNGQDCYVLAGEFKAHDIILWVNKNTFLIPQLQFVFGGALEEDDLKGLPPAQKSQLMTWSKLKGTITETYEKITTNKALLAANFASPYMPAFAQAAGGMRTRGAGGGEGRPPPPPKGSLSPMQLTRRVRPQDPSNP
jgi:hypothetical protein